MTTSGVSLNWGGLERALVNITQNLADQRVLLESVGEMLVSSTLQRFEDEENPDGTAWTSSRRATSEGGTTLTDSAQLRSSIDAVVTDDAVTVGSNVKYAHIHQLGGKAGRGRKVTLPSRPYLGVSDEDRADAQEFVADFLAALSRLSARPLGGGKA